MKLTEMQAGQSALIQAMPVEGELVQRLSALGMRTGREVTLLRRGWLGGPMQLRIGHTEFMLRASAAGGIEVQLLAAAPSATSAVGEFAA